MLDLPHPDVHRSAVARAGTRAAWRRRRWPAVALLVALLLPAAATVAQAAGLLYLVQDINTAPGASNPTALTVFSGKVYFSAGDGTHGFQRWATDGSTTAMVTGAGFPINPFDANIGNLTGAGVKLYFTANNGSDGNQLWAYDGSNATELRINPSNG